MLTIITAQDIYQDLKAKILNFDYQPGQAISENTLSREYQVSRTVIREALGKLKSDDLIEVYPSRGTYITLLNLREIKDVIYLRTAVEQQVYRDAYKLKDGILPKRMKENLEAQRKMIRLNPEMHDYRALDTGFHQLVYQEVGRIYLWNKIKDMLYHYRRFCMMDLSMNRPYETLVEEHQKIYEAFVAGDLETLDRQLADHLNNNIRRFEKEKEVMDQKYFEKEL